MPFNKHDLPQTGTLLLLLLFLQLIHIYQCMLHCWPGETAGENFSLQALVTLKKKHLKMKLMMFHVCFLHVEMYIPRLS